MNFNCALLLALLLVATPVYADIVTVSPQKTVIGKNVKIVITVDLKKGETAYPPESVKTPEGVELKPSGDSSIKKHEDGSATQKFIVTLTPYTIGEVAIEPIKYSVTDAAGKRVERETEPLTFQVESVRNENRETPKDIKDVAGIKPRWAEFLWDIALIMAAIIAGALLWRWWSKRKSKKEEADVFIPPKRAAHEITYERLDKLRAQTERGEVGKREFFFLVSEIIREYLENRYPILALERTTPELKSELKNGLLPEKSRTRLFELLELCDFVKFAKTEPENEWGGMAISKATMIVDETRARPTEQI